MSHYAHLLCYNYQVLQYRNHRVSLKFPSQATLWDCSVEDQWKRQPPLLPYLHLPPPRRVSSAAVYAPWKIDQTYIEIFTFLSLFSWYFILFSISEKKCAVTHSNQFFKSVYHKSLICLYFHPHNIIILMFITLCMILHNFFIFISIINANPVKKYMTITL